MPLRSILAAFLTCVFLGSSAQAEISLMSFNDFEDGTTQDWTRGNFPVSDNPMNIATGGPGGVDDNFLQVTASGIPDVPGGRLVVTNAVGFGETWTGDYVGAGVTAISLDLINLSTFDLNIRLGLSDDQFGQTGFMTEDILLVAGAGWSSHTFSIAEADVINDTGLVYSDVFQNIETIRVIDNFLPFYAGTVRGRPGAFGMDNVRALAGTAIPEPSTFSLCGLVGALFASRRRRRV